MCDLLNTYSSVLIPAEHFVAIQNLTINFSSCSAAAPGLSVSCIAVKPEYELEEKTGGLCETTSDEHFIDDEETR